MNNEAKNFEKTTYPESGLTDYELEIEELVDKIKSTERTLECIGLIRNFIERKSVGNNADLESAKCNKHGVIKSVCSDCNGLTAIMGTDGVFRPCHCQSQTYL